MSRSTVVVRFTGDTADLKRGIGQVDKGLSGIGGKASKMSTGMKVALGSAAGLAVKFGKDSVDAFVEAEAAQSQLDAAFAKFPALAGANADALRGLNEELARKTKFDDDAIASGQSVLAQFDLSADQLKNLTPLMLDYAERTGKDLPTAAKDLGKAVQGQGKALKGIGIQFKDTSSKAGNLEELMGSLDAKVGGVAETAGGTSAGKMKILSNQFGELQEKVGARLLPALLKLADILRALVDWFAKLSPGMQVAVGVLVALAAGMFAVVKAVKAWEAAQAALDVVLTANPIGLIIIAIAAFVAGVVIAYQKVGWFRKGVDTAFNAVKFVIMAVFNWVKSNWPLLLAILTGPIGLAVLLIAKHWGTIKAGATAVKDWVVGAFNGILGFFRGLPGTLSRLATSAWNALKHGLKAAVDWIIRQIDRALGPLDEIAGKLGGIIGKAGGALGGALSHVPGFAAGVTGFSGGLAVVGEDGPELVNLPRGSDVIPMRRSARATAAAGGSGGGVVIVHEWHIAGSVLAERDLIALINRAERKGIR